MPCVCEGVDVLLQGLKKKFCSNHACLAEQQATIFQICFSLVLRWNTLSVIIVTYLYQKCQCEEDLQTDIFISFWRDRNGPYAIVPFAPFQPHLSSSLLKRFSLMLGSLRTTALIYNF